MSVTNLIGWLSNLSISWISLDAILREDVHREINCITDNGDKIQQSSLNNTRTCNNFITSFQS